jgi:hypothetical protein
VSDNPPAKNSEKARIRSNASRRKKAERSHRACPDLPFAEPLAGPKVHPGHAV